MSTNTYNIMPRANKALDISAKFWFLVTAIGLWMFGYYIVRLYGGLLYNADFDSWGDHMVHGIVSGDFIGNIAVVSHMILAFIIAFGGPLQLVPAIRNRFPKFHKWNGRIYIFTSVLIAIGGVYMVWTRGNLGGVFSAVAITIDAILIIFFSWKAIRAAFDKKMGMHRIWALRAFIVINGVWYFRIGFGLWIFINQGAPGSTEALDGPFDRFLAFANYLIPLAFLELYLYAKKYGSVIGKYAVTCVVFVLALATAIGIFMALQIFWLPSL